MTTTVAEESKAPTGGEARDRLLAAMPVEERRMELDGISTAVLEGGSGPPIVLLHGPGEFGAKWMRVIPRLVESHSVVVPDLPAHGASEAPDGPLGADRMISWLDELCLRTCSSPPVIIGHVLGGALGVRFALEREDALGRLVLVDSLGLARFRPGPRFALTMVGFLARPNERSYERFMRQCSYDLDALREGMGDRWEPFVSYNIGNASSPASKAAGRIMRAVGIPRIPPRDLARLAVPTALIWGRQDRANRVRIAERASARYGWELHVIEQCADDPPRDRPEEFLRALRSVLGRSSGRPGVEQPPAGLQG